MLQKNINFLNLNILQWITRVVTNLFDLLTCNVSRLSVEMDGQKQHLDAAFARGYLIWSVVSQHIPHPLSPTLDRAWRTARASSSQETAGAGAPETNTLHAESAWVQERKGRKKTKYQTRYVREGMGERTKTDKSKVKTKQMKKVMPKMISSNKAETFSLHERRSGWEHSTGFTPLSGRCPSRGARRVAFVGPSSSTGQERSSWPICGTQRWTCDKLFLKTAAKDGSDAESVDWHQPNRNDSFINIHLLLLGPVESTSDCSRGKKPCS